MTAAPLFSQPVPLSDAGIIFADADPLGRLIPELPDAYQLPQYTAVIDIGSGSARAVVMQVNPGGGIEIVAQQSINLNLMSHLDPSGALDAAGVASALDALEDFALIARGFGVSAVHAVATAALRESGNGAALARAASERFGIPLRIIDGQDEAAYCFVGAIHGLPVSDGILVDIGGGSAEIVTFTDRRLQSVASLPLGSLRIANQFRLSDLPEADDVRAACDHVRATLTDAGVPMLPASGHLVGSGGSVRLLSRLDRAGQPYPIIKVHGYQIGADALARQVDSLAAVSRAQRAGIRGMNPARAHSVIGGAIVAHALARHVNAANMVVSGQGLREGLARQPQGLRLDQTISVPPLPAVRTGSLTDLVSRFAPRFARRGQRRARVAGRLAEAVWGDRRPEFHGALLCAAFLLDIGNAVDYYNRPNRTASIIVRTDLPGFTHRESALAAAVLLRSEGNDLPYQFRRSRLIDGDDATIIGQAAAALILADEIDSRLPPECSADAVQFRREAGTFIVNIPGWSQLAAAGIRQQWQRAFGEPIHISRCEL